MGKLVINNSLFKDGSIVSSLSLPLLMNIKSLGDVHISNTQFQNLTNDYELAISDFACGYPLTTPQRVLIEYLNVYGSDIKF
jgi:hypothetical protein